MVHLPEALEAGRLLKMKIFFSFGPDINSIEILCQVIWTDRLRGEEGYRSGVKFLKVSKKDLDKLINFLKKLTK